MWEASPITLFILITTVIASVMAFSNPELRYKLMFIPYNIKHRKNQEYRFLAHIFIHADWMHLLFNMYVLYGFGTYVEWIFQELDPGAKGMLNYGMLYFGGALFATLVPFGRNKDNPNYLSLGASGAVSAVIFASIILIPGIEIGLFFLPKIPGYLFGILYLAFEFYMDKRGNTGIAHDAHIGGAVFGVVYVIVTQFNQFQTFIAFLLN
jgi:membrane associated rhomboid family serine protease